MMFKKIFRFFLIFFLITVYLNIGYWSGQSWIDGYEKLQAKQPVDGFQKFQLGAWEAMQPADTADSITSRIIGMLIWPVGLIMSLASWITYGIIQATAGIWAGIVFLGIQIGYGAVFLWNFFFCGGFFKLLGIISYHWILVVINLLIAICLFFWGLKHQRSLKRDGVSAGPVLVIISTIMVGFLIILMLTYGEMEGYWAFYILWHVCLIVSFLLNIFKVEA